MYDTKQVIQYLNEKLPNAKCPLCQRPLITSDNPNDGVNLEGTRVMLMHMTGDGYDMKLGDNKATLSIEMVCKNCGYIMLLRAKEMLGV